jgi:hypothetical protein
LIAILHFHSHLTYNRKYLLFSSALFTLILKICLTLFLPAKLLKTVTYKYMDSLNPKVQVFSFKTLEMRDAHGLAKNLTRAEAPKRSIFFKWPWWTNIKSQTISGPGFFFLRGRGDIVPRKLGISQRKSHGQSLHNDLNAFYMKLLLKKIINFLFSLEIWKSSKGEHDFISKSWNLHMNKQSRVSHI